MRKGFTLIELLIAVSLVGVIILAIVGVDLASRKFVNSADFAARAQNDISPALEHMVKNISRGVGNSVNLPIGGYTDNRGIRIWVGNDDPAINPGQRDHMIAYRHEGTSLRYCNSAPGSVIALPNPGVISDTTCPGGWEELANKLLFTTNPLGVVDLDPPPDPLWGLIIIWPGGSPSSNSLVDITLRARQNPAAAESPDNPQVELTTTVAMRGVSAN